MQHDGQHVTAVSAQALPVHAPQRRREADRARPVGLVTRGAMLREQCGAVGRGGGVYRQAQRDAGGAPCGLDHATPTITEVVQWNIELVLAMHQLMSL